MTWQRSRSCFCDLEVSICHQLCPCSEKKGERKSEDGLEVRTLGVHQGVWPRTARVRAPVSHGLLVVWWFATTVLSRVVLGFLRIPSP